MGAVLQHGWNIWMITTLTWAAWAMCSTSASLPRSWNETMHRLLPRNSDTGRAGCIELGGKGYLAIQSCENGWDTLLPQSDYSVMDGGQLDAPGTTIPGSP